MASYTSGSMGRSAPPAAILYQATQAGRPVQNEPPPPEAQEERTFKVVRSTPRPPLPTRPTPPKSHGPWCQMWHKHRNEDEVRKYHREMATYNREYANALKEQEKWDNAVVTVPPPQPRELPQMSPEEEAMYKSKKEVPLLVKEIDDTRNAIAKLQMKCMEAKTAAKNILRQPDQKPMASTYILDFMMARKALVRAERAYAEKSLQIDGIVEQMERFNRAIDDKRRVELQETLGIATYDAELEVKAIRDSLKSFNMPSSFFESARKENESEMEALTREFSAEAAEELHKDLASQLSVPMQSVQEVLPPMEGRIPLAN